MYIHRVRYMRVKIYIVATVQRLRKKHGTKRKILLLPYIYYVKHKTKQTNIATVHISRENMSLNKQISFAIVHIPRENMTLKQISLLLYIYYVKT
jgi:hypothetical protein